jgi:hypothetical protein
MAAAPPPVQKGGNKGCLIALGVVFALLVLGAVFSIVAITFLGNKAEDKLEELGDAVSTPQTVDPQDLDALEEDHLLDVGEGARISGFTATIREARFASSFEGLPEGSYLVLSVEVENRDDDAQSYDLSHWHVQQPDGTLTPPIVAEALTGGTLAPGSHVEGRLVFQVGDDTGDYFAIYRPDILDEARGIWTVSR